VRIILACHHLRLRRTNFAEIHADISILSFFGFFFKPEKKPLKMTTCCETSVNSISLALFGASFVLLPFGGLCAYVAGNSRWFEIPEFYIFYLVFVSGVFIACGSYTLYHAIKILCIQRRKNTEEDELKEIIFNSYDDYGYTSLGDLNKYKRCEK